MVLNMGDMKIKVAKVFNQRTNVLGNVPKGNKTGKD